ncbi:cytochrome c biogenesis CcdA family protein [Actinomyces sp. 432]|uniref:cytochrome c biogenesis CcdA family protein n=1 Tax=Actinomyces sp. 432 TaxID=2057798 RepID=UPI001F268FD8|nr:cytochrome c biogenesis protein CcdA [Actinomyces sp. 432]
MELTLPVALLAGLVSFASPCFLPIVPAFVGQLVGAGSGPVRRRAALANSLSFVLGFSVVFIALWAALGLLGRSLGPYVVHLRIVAGAVLVLMGLHVAGILTLRPFDTQVRASGPADAAGSPLRAALMGIAFGAGWTPCIGPILGAFSRWRRRARRSGPASP